MTRVIEEPCCDKCGGTKFSEELDNPEPGVKHIKASEYFHDKEGSNLSILSSTSYTTLVIGEPSCYKVTCKKCGAIYRYTVSP